MGRNWAIWLVPMSHKTTSWKSHMSTWRWTAGNDGRSPEGEKAHRVGGHPTLTRQKTVAQHDRREMAMQPIPTPALVMIQTTLALGVLIELLDGPAAVGQLDQPVQRCRLGQVTEIPLDLAAVARHRALAEQPAFWAGRDAMMAGRQLCAARGPVHPHGSKLFSEDNGVMFTPRDRLPMGLRQGLEDSLGRIQRRWARLLGLATALRTGWGHQRGGGHVVGQADTKAAADADHVSELPGLKAVQEGRVVPVAGVGHDPGKRDPPRLSLVDEGER